MIEMQKYWDLVMSSKAEIDTISSGLKALEKDLAARKSKLAVLGSVIKEMKTSLK